MKKMQRISQETHFGYIDASNLRFYSISLKFEPQMHKGVLLTNSICKNKKAKEKRLFNFC